MNRKVLILALAVAAIASAVLFACPAEAMETFQNGSETDESLFEKIQHPDDVRGPGPSAMMGVQNPPGSDMGRPIPPEFLDEEGSVAEGKQRMQPPMAEPKMELPGKEVPRYEHDGKPQDFEACLEPMVDGDIRVFDPDFVADAIDFAEDNGLHEVAEILRAKLASIIEYNMRSSSNINSADSRASGLDDGPEDDADIIIVEEEDDPEKDTVPFGEPIPDFYISFSAPAAPHLILLSL